MQQRAGILFLSKSSKRIMLILNDQHKWTVPTFEKKTTILEDSKSILDKFSKGKIVPIELYLSEDKGFEYGTYVCLVSDEFLSQKEKTISWCSLEHLPKQLHNGLKVTLNNAIIKAKLETILEIDNASF